MDAKTLETARHGDHHAQAAILREFQDPWFRLCLSLLRNAELAKDATQETAFRFLKQLPTFRGDSQLRTWSLGIAINVCRELRRRHHRPIAQPLWLVADRPLDPAHAAESAEAAATVHALLADLPDRQREVVMLRFFEELSVDETATAMDCAAGTVKATLHQALKALKKKLGALTP